MMEEAPAARRGYRWSSLVAPCAGALARGASWAVRRPRVEGWDVEHWPVVADGRHNLTTDLTEWRGLLYLVHSSSAWHIGADSSVRIWRSVDGFVWEESARLRFPGADIRDPKFAVIGGRLFLYVLRNEGVLAEPSGTAVTSSDDGASWSELKDCEPRGWLFWRPKTRDGRTWYVGAYWKDHGESRLLRSRDGEHWDEVSRIHRGDFNDETDLEFLPDGTAVATARLEVSGSALGHRDGCTLIARAKPPYDAWESRRCRVTRLDGPNLFAHGGEIFALGRRHVAHHRRWHHPGSVLGRKRTALFHVRPDGLRHLTDLPSCGDTGYPGAVKRGADLLISYYTSPLGRDVRWLPGMFLPSEIRMARLPLSAFERGY